MTTLLPIGALRPADSPRAAGVDPAHVRMLAGLDVPLPPIVVHRPTMRVVDGMHRVRAATLRGDEFIRATYRDGSEADAFVAAVQLNCRHGKPLSSDERAAAAARIIASHPQWSDRAIAEVAGVATRTVAAIRMRATGPGQQLNARVGKDGRARPVDAAVGRRRAGNVVAARPDATLREISAEAGIALGTARDVRDRIRRGEDPVPAGLGRRSARTVFDDAEPAAEATLQSLCKDPSLRLNESGRTLLRLLTLHQATARQWHQAPGGIPPHCSAAVARLARRCADDWLLLARTITAQQHADGAVEC